MCRNIRTLHFFEPPTTEDEIRAASIQYVRKVSGILKPSREAEEIFNRAVEDITAATKTLLKTLPKKGEPKDRDREKEKARARFAARDARR